jgi:hypothetical protein
LFLPIIVYTLSSTKLRDKGKIVSAGYQGGGGERGGGEMTQTLYALMNKKKMWVIVCRAVTNADS